MIIILEKYYSKCFVVGEANTGTDCNSQQKQKKLELFKKETFILQGTSRIYVLTTPHIMGTTETSSRPVCPSAD